MKELFNVALICSMLAVVCMATPSHHGQEASAQSLIAVPQFHCGMLSYYSTSRFEWYRINVCDTLQGTCLVPNNIQACTQNTNFIVTDGSHKAISRGMTHVVNFYKTFNSACYGSAIPVCGCPAGSGNGGARPLAQAEANGRTQGDSEEMSTEMPTEDLECRSVTLPNGDVLYDPLECDPNFKPNAKAQHFAPYYGGRARQGTQQATGRAQGDSDYLTTYTTDDGLQCTSMKLPTGEVLYDPFECNPSFNPSARAQHAGGRVGQGKNTLAYLLKLLQKKK